MPNTPLLVGAGAAAYCLGRHATEHDEGTLRALLEGAGNGIITKVPEVQMDAVSCAPAVRTAVLLRTRRSWHNVGQHAVPTRRAHC
jgi:pyrroline-5-carboxylate reductase